MYRSFLLNISTLSFFILLSGCDIQRPRNLTQVKDDIIDYYDSGAFADEVKAVVDRALQYFERRICCDDSSSVVFDIDDTLLWSYLEMKRISFGYIPKLYHAWVLQANAPVVPHIKELYDFFVRRGCSIILLTGRREDEREATIKNLHNLGFYKIDKLIMRSENEMRVSAQEYKTYHRKKLLEEGYHIVATVGDQASDLNGGYAFYRVKIPNYTYIIY